MLVALALASAALLGQTAPPGTRPAKPALSSKPWPDDEVMNARREEAQERRLFAEASPLEFTLTADFSAINAERSPNNTKLFPGVLTVGGADIPVQLGSRGHLRLKATTCDFVPIRVVFSPERAAGTVFDGQTSLKLGTHCRTDFDRYVVREALSYQLANLVTPLSFRSRVARATYVDAKSKKAIGTHAALFLEHESDVARRLAGREVRQKHMMFADFDRNALTTTMLLEYMLGNTDYSIAALHNIVIVQNKARKFFPVAYDFDSSGLVNAPYAAPDPRLFGIHSVTDRLYRGPCRTVDEIDAVAATFRARQADMFAALDAASALDVVSRREMKTFLEAFFRRIATRDSIKSTFVDGCPATRNGV